ERVDLGVDLVELRAQLGALRLQYFAALGGLAALGARRRRGQQAARTERHERGEGEGAGGTAHEWAPDQASVVPRVTRTPWSTNPVGREPSYITAVNAQIRVVSDS